MTQEKFLHHFEQVRGRTINFARCIPADKAEWSARDGGFSLGGLACRIAAAERLVFAEGASGRPSRYAGCGPELAEGREAVLTYMETMHAEAMAIFGGGWHSLPPTVSRRAAAPTFARRKAEISARLSVLPSFQPPTSDLKPPLPH